MLVPPIPDERVHAGLLQLLVCVGQLVQSGEEGVPGLSKVPVPGQEVPGEAPLAQLLVLPLRDVQEVVPGLALRGATKMGGWSAREPKVL